jgi:SNF2 family DNA or RNA helicase
MINRRLRNYQIAARNFLMRRRRAVLGSEVRTGKTPVAITAADEVFGAYNQSDRSSFREQIWVICPSNVKYTFAEQIKDWSVYGEYLQVIESEKEVIDDSKTWVVMSYNMATKILDALGPDAKPPLICIMDEAHHVKNFGAKRTQATIGAGSILKKTRATWLLTGTPFPNKLIDCYALFNFCLYGKLGKYWDFAAKHCFIKQGHFGKKVVGCRRENLPELVEKVKDILHRDTLEAVWKEMPKRQDIIITLSHTERSRQLCDGLEAHKEAIKEAIEHGEDFNPPELMGLRKEIATEKIDQATQFALDLITDVRPIIVAGRHLELLNNLFTQLKSQCEAAIITGATNPKDRDRIRLEFQAGKIDCLVLSLEAGGEGIDLSAADTMVLCEEAWTPKTMAQVKGRIIAIGKEKVLTYYYLMFPDSIDKDVHKSLLAKERDIKRFFNVLENRQDDTGIEKLQDQDDVIHWD